MIESSMYQMLQIQLLLKTFQGDRITEVCAGYHLKLLLSNLIFFFLTEHIDLYLSSDIILSRVETEKRYALIKAWVENEKAKVENK
jgi:hypothetical protein